jgi:hypothetical protein
VFVVDGTGTFVRDLNLKATEAANGDIIPVSSFEIEPEDVVQVKQGGNFLVFTGSNEDVIEKVKVVSAQGVTTELVNLGGNSWSIQGLATGVYTLDVIVDTGDEKAAFETILVVLGADQSPINPLTIINNFETKTIIKFRDNGNGNNTKPKPDLRGICALNPSDPRCPEPIDGDCPPGWGTNEAGQCFPLGDCPDGFHRANDDETGRCVPEDDLKQCEDGSWAHKDDQCPEIEDPCDVDIPPAGCEEVEPPLICQQGEEGGEDGRECPPPIESGPGSPPPVATPEPEEPEEEEEVEGEETEGEEESAESTGEDSGEGSPA